MLGEYFKTLKELQNNPPPSHIHCAICSEEIRIEGEDRHYEGEVVESKLGMSLFQTTAKFGDKPVGGVFIRAFSHRTCISGPEERSDA